MKLDLAVQVLKRYRAQTHGGDLSDRDFPLRFNVVTEHNSSKRAFADYLVGDSETPC
jgi:hypothetical protein